MFTSPVKKCLKCLQLVILINRPFHGLWRHLEWWANTAKIIVNVWNFGPLGTAIGPLQRGGFPWRKCTFEDICTEIIFMKYKEEISYKTF